MRPPRSPGQAGGVQVAAFRRHIVTCIRSFIQPILSHTQTCMPSMCPFANLQQRHDAAAANSHQSRFGSRIGSRRTLTPRFGRCLAFCTALVVCMTRLSIIVSLEPPSYLSSSRGLKKVVYYHTLRRPPLFPGLCWSSRPVQSTVPAWLPLSLSCVVSEAPAAFPASQPATFLAIALS